MVSISTYDTNQKVIYLFKYFLGIHYSFIFIIFMYGNYSALRLAHVFYER